METTFKILLLVALSSILSCGPIVTKNLQNTHKPLNPEQEVFVIELDQEEPDDADYLGDIKVGDSGFSTNCNYGVVLNKAKIEARKVGGNAIKVVSHKFPSMMGSSCHRIAVRVLKIKNTDNYNIQTEEPLLDVDYAILNVYRFSGMGSLIGYDLHLQDSVICRVKNNFKRTIHIKKEGLDTLWAKTESKSEIPINLKKGKTYYLRCGISMGIFVGHPELELVDAKTGKAEFEAFKAKHQ